MDDYHLSMGDASYRLTTHVVTSNFFSLLGIPPVLGRTFVAEDGEPGRPSVALLSEGAWRDMFGADPTVVGRRVRLVGWLAEPTDYEIIGIAPIEAPVRWLPSPGLFIPEVVGGDTPDPGAVRQVIGRLAQGVSPAAAEDELLEIDHRRSRVRSARRDHC